MRSTRHPAAPLFVWLPLLLLAACSGARGDKILCGDISECPANSACDINFTCSDPATAIVRARATAVPPEVQVMIAPRVGRCRESSLAGACEVPALSEVVLTAPLVDGWRFDHWQASDGAPVSSLELCKGTSAELVLPELRVNAACTAVYVRRWRIAGFSEGGATEVLASSDSPFASCNDGACEVDEGAAVVLTARSRGRFAGWSGEGCSGSEPVLSVVASRDLTCRASSVGRFSVSAVARGADVPIAVTPGSGAPCEGSVCVLDQGTPITLSAPELAGFRFTGWSGDEPCRGNEPRLTLTSVDADTACVASYVARFRVRASSEGVPAESAPSAVSDSEAARCEGGSCEVDEGGVVTLLAPSVDGFRFVGWSGEACESIRAAAARIADVRANVSCVARYEPGIAVAGALVGAAGDVEASSDSPFSLCQAGSCRIEAGGSVTLTAPELPGSRFLGWEGDEGCSGSERTLRFEQVSASKTCYARFSARLRVRASAEPSEGGSVRVSSSSASAVCDDSGCELDAQSPATLEASAREGFRFVGYSGDPACTGEQPRLELARVADDVRCVGSFASRLTVVGVAAPEEGGSVRASSSSPGASCMASSCLLDSQSSSTVTLSAAPAAGFAFTGWRDCGMQPGAELTLSDLTEGTTCTATFSRVRYQVVGDAWTPGGSVRASSSATGAQCIDGRCVVDHGSAVTLLAIAEPGYRFLDWEGCASSEQPELTLPSVTSDLACRASFEPAALTVAGLLAPAQSGSVEVSSSSPGAQCSGASCSLSVGDAATLVAQAAAGFSFERWSGCSSSNEPTLTLSAIAESQTCTANFVAVRRPTVVGTLSPSGAGTISASSSASGADCAGERCSVAAGSTVVLSALGGAGLSFLGWSGCPSGVADGTTLTLPDVQADLTCQANFQPLVYTVSGRAAPVSGGNVSASSDNMSCPDARCSVSFGSTVVLTASPVDGYEFASWSGCPSGLGSGTTLTLSGVTSDSSCQANFRARELTIEGRAEPALAASVSAGTDTMSCADARCVVQEGDAVELSFTQTEEQARAYIFVDWTGCPESSTASRLSLPNVRASATCSANFAPRPPARFNVDGTVTPAGGGTVTASSDSAGATCAGARCTVNEGATVTLTASAASGFVFQGFSCPSQENVATVANVSADASCIATFQPSPPTRFTVSGSVASSGGGSVVATSDSANASCQGASCTVDEGATVLLTASAATGYSFASWSCPSQGNVAAVGPVTADGSCTATFTQLSYPVSGTVVPAAAGSIVVSAGACAAASCQVPHGTRATVAVSQSPEQARRYVFRGYRGCPGTTPTIELPSVTGPLACEANFDLRPPTRFTVSGVAGLGGSVSAASDSANASCQGSACTVDEGSTVRLTASAASGFVFASWSCPSEGNVAVIGPVAANSSCTASFTPLSYVVTGSATPLDGGSVSVSSGSCTAASCTVPFGAAATLTATAARGFVFESWSGCSGSASGITMRIESVTAQVECTARFVAARPDLVAVVTITGASSTQSDGRIALPVRVVITNDGNAAAPTSKLSLEYLSASGAWFLLGFGVPGQPAGEVFTGPLAAGASATFNGSVTFAPTAVSGTVSIRAYADSCAGEEFTPPYCRVDESNEGNNVSPVATATLTIPSFPVLAQVTPTGSGTVVASAQRGTCDGMRCSIQIGGSVTFTARPATGFTFVGWGGCSGTTSGTSHTIPNVTGPDTCTARFAAARPDLISTITVTGGPRAYPDDSTAVPVSVVITNVGGAAAPTSKVSLLHFNEELGSWYYLRFQAPGAGLYPFTGPLAAGASVTITGDAILGNSLGGSSVPILALADSCSGEENVPAYCRVDESDELNNPSAAVNAAFTSTGLQLDVDPDFQNVTLTDAEKASFITKVPSGGAVCGPLFCSIAPDSSVTLTAPSVISVDRNGSNYVTYFWRWECTGQAPDNSLTIAVSPTSSMRCVALYSPLV